MTDRSKVIFGNPMPAKVVRKAERGQAKMIRRYGDDRGKAYHLALKDNAVIGESLGVRELVMAQEPLESLPENPLVVGNIRMGFGHYRISMAIASFEDPILESSGKGGLYDPARKGEHGEGR